MNNAKHHVEIIRPSKFSPILNETTYAPIFTKENHTKTIVATLHDEGNSTKHIINPPPLMKEKVEVFTKVPTKKLDPCIGKYIYAYDLPSRFNEDLLKGCHSLMKWEDMCPHLTNLGLGPKIVEEPDGNVLSKKNWYATNQFSLEVIFHNIMKNYKCLTNDSSLASAIYVPYYPGLDVGRYLWGGFNISIRDESPKALMKFLGQQPQWKRMLGKDHFMIGGRIGWDFRRKRDENEDWGTKLMFLPQASNMSFLLIEACGLYDNEFPIPYPTYFHPSNDDEILMWQNKIRKMKRPYLFSFAGAPRPNSTSSIRNELMKQCESSKSCKLFSCYNSHNSKKHCGDPVGVMEVFQNSVFCLQPPGDSYTRRSTFDSILGGCIPVFFHPQSAYKQYLWHFPKNYSSYSVYIPEIDVKEKRVMINETLFNISKSQVLAMREEIIGLIPKILYRDPSSRLEKYEDAFDVAVKGVLRRIEAMRRDNRSN
ncbi:xyloglucan galactosyltransferase KATAMARI1 homolog [Cicer arietinum]|uniref:xyloglucan galactosyltransferase KATAMARI1 homolog n=1 Tax=Cicer arietinum TaxID=3827 RepID=UPI003CC528C4